jgi:TPR repeat protein
MSSAFRTWSAAAVAVTIIVIIGCDTSNPQIPALPTNLDAYSIDPPRPYPTPSLPTKIPELAARAGAGDPIAQCRLGVDLDLGRGVRRNYARALDWFTRSAAQHDGCGITNLGNMHLHGDGVPVNYAAASAYFNAGAQVGYAGAYYGLGVLQWFGDGVDVDERLATEWFKKAAAANYSLAYTSLGDLYAYGHMFKVRNVGLAVQYYRMGLSTQDVDACNCAAYHRRRASQCLAFLYSNVYHGDDSRRYRLALELYRRTSTDPWTQYQISEMYHSGFGVKQDDDIAAIWLKKSADQGYGPAATRYAAYLLGSGGRSAHIGEALKYVHEAVELGDADGMGELADMKWSGWHVPRDRKGAIELYKMASARGSIRAINALANRYYVGDGVARDRYEAYILFHVEADIGAAWGAGVREALERQLTRTQIQAAQFEIKKLDHIALTALQYQTDLPPVPDSSKTTT